MKKIIFFLLTALLCLSFIACATQEGLQDSISEAISDVTDINGISQNSDDLDTSFSSDSDNNELDFSSNESDVTISETSQPLYDSIENFISDYSTAYPKLIDLSKLFQSFEITSIIPHDDHYSVNSLKAYLNVYPLSAEEKDLESWRVYVGQWGKDKIDIYNSIEEFNKATGTKAYKYIKEGVDMYIVRYAGEDNYEICFKIEDHIFMANALSNYVLEKDQLPSSDEYEKLKPEFENHMCFYELSDLSNESSELVRILKECVAEAE
jgi:hypothetical protein